MLPKNVAPTLAKNVRVIGVCAPFRTHQSIRKHESNSPPAKYWACRLKKHSEVHDDSMGRLTSLPVENH